MNDAIRTLRLTLARTLLILSLSAGSLPLHAADFGPGFEVKRIPVDGATISAAVGGVAGVLIRRNAIVVFMCVELMLNAVNLSFIAFAKVNGTLDGQILAFFVMVVAAAEVVVGLGILVAIFRKRSSASVDDVNLLKG